MVRQCKIKIFHRPICESISIPAAVSFLLGVTGPFGSYEALEFIPRLLFWTAISYFYFALLLLGAPHVERWTRQYPILVRRIILVFIVTTVGAPLVVELKYHVLLDGTYKLEAFIKCWIESFGIILSATIINTLTTDSLTNKKHGTDRSLRPRLYDRLGFEYISTDYIVSLTADNHHVIVLLADGGSERILIRFSDAIQEMDDVPGFMVHRSHWVIRSHIVGGFRKGGKDFIELFVGGPLPVSSKYKPTLIEAGFVFAARPME